MGVSYKWDGDVVFWTFCIIHYQSTVQLQNFNTLWLPCWNHAHPAPSCCKITTQTPVHIKLLGYCRYSCKTDSFFSANQLECRYPEGILDRHGLQRSIKTHLNYASSLNHQTSSGLTIPANLLSTSSSQNPRLLGCNCCKSNALSASGPVVSSKSQRAKICESA